MRGRLTLHYISVFLMTCLVGTTLCAQQNSSWQLALEKDGIEVYVHRSVDMRVRGFKACATLNVPFDSLEVIFDKIEDYPEWQAKIKTAKMVHEFSDKKYHFQSRTKLPWPSKNHDLMWRVEKGWDERDGSLVYKQVCSSNTMPDKMLQGSVLQAFASWRLKPVNEDEVEITYYLSVDKGGKIPSWIINLLSPNNPYDTLVNLQSMRPGDLDELVLD